MKTYHVYIMASASDVLYTGVTGDLVRRVDQHQKKLTPGFTSRYKVGRLVWFEGYSEPRLAIAREKQVKGWLRRKKVQLIEAVNPEWKDLSSEWHALPQSGPETGRIHAGTN